MEQIRIDFYGNSVFINFNRHEFEGWNTGNLRGFAGVYLICDEEDQVIYVGMSKNLGRRIYDHFSGKTNTNKFHNDMKYILTFTEDDIYKREALEKVLINQFRPKGNGFLQQKGRNHGHSEDTIIMLKHLLDLGVYSNDTIASFIGLSKYFVSNVKKGKSYAFVEVPEGYKLDEYPEKDKGVYKNKSSLEHAYKLYHVSGHTYKSASEKAGLKESYFRTFMTSKKRKNYIDLRKEFEQKYGKRNKHLKGQV
ncbi:GIY-YIG nuclease family protein [Halobacillus karajensis]|uniref:GIY-YIG nuclease family protein n=1 Tax=Halobacillus karajensis TaxID=195088 RepID=UPI00045CD0C0|nr:GIY-YIG nuclease family protein [Halobacillus karajensis]CDQ21684.1 excinuclease ABC subunit C [Halobacillus karajensis]